MGRLFSHWRWPGSLGDAEGRPGFSRRRTASLSTRRVVRIAIATVVGFYFFGAALVSDDPIAMLVGTLPIAWIAIEFAWVALHPPQAADRD